MQSDLSNLNLISNKSIKDNPKLLIHERQILVTRSGTVGRMTFANSLMDGMSCTEHVMRVEADDSKILSGYLYSFMNSKFGIPLIVSGTYGAVVRHIEPEHIENMPIPRLDDCIEEKSDCLIKRAAELRVEYQTKLNSATELLFKSAGLKDISAFEWHNQGSDTGFIIKLQNSLSIRALNFNPRFAKLISNLQSVTHKTLGDICKGGALSRGGRFVRIDATPEFGIQLLGQKQGFWTKPEGRWIAAKYAKDEISMPDESIVLAGLGTLGEREVFCRSVFITGDWLNYGYSENFLRIIRTDPDVTGAYLFAFLRSETAFRCLRSICAGSKQHYLNIDMLKDLPIPVINKQERTKVENLIREAFLARDSADRKEAEAIELVEIAIEAAPPKH